MKRKRKLTDAAREVARVIGRSSIPSALGEIGPKGFKNIRETPSGYRFKDGGRVFVLEVRELVES